MDRAKTHFPFLDGFRGIATLAVFLFHSLGVAFDDVHKLPWHGVFHDFHAPGLFLALYPLTYGDAGVALFFVVSGFCIHLSHSRDPQKSLGRFACRRFFRLYPPYLLAVCLFFFVWPWGSFHFWGQYRPLQIATHALMIHNLDPRTFFGINTSFWSVAVEAQLYVLYPLLLAMASRFGWTATLAVAALGEISLCTADSLHDNFSIGPLSQPLFFGPFAYWLSWALGAYLCECFLTGRTSRLFSVRFDLLFVVAVALPLCRLTQTFTFLGFAWLTAVAIERFLRGKWVVPTSGAWNVLWSHLSFLGVVSYSFYLLHQPIVKLTHLVLEPMFPVYLRSPAAKFSVCLVMYPFVLTLAYAMFRMVERPSIELGKRVQRRLSPRTLPMAGGVQMPPV